MDCSSLCELPPFLYAYVIFLNFYFFNHPPPSKIYTLSLHDALPISPRHVPSCPACAALDRIGLPARRPRLTRGRDRKSTRLNSSHANISYAVFCLKKKK